jgi:TctA family transporter
MYSTYSLQYVPGGSCRATSHGLGLDACLGLGVQVEQEAALLIAATACTPLTPGPI